MAEADEVVLVLRVLEHFGLGYMHSVRSVLDIAEDGSLGPVVILL